MKILLVESRAELRKYVLDTLRTAEYQVESVRSVTEIGRCIPLGRPVILITSWHPRGLVAQELLQQIHSNSLVDAYSILLLEPNSSSSDVLQGLQAGADDFVFQHGNAAELIQRVAVAERILHLKQVKDHLSAAPLTAPNFSKRKTLATKQLG